MKRPLEVAAHMADQLGLGCQHVHCSHSMRGALGVSVAATTTSLCPISGGSITHLSDNSWSSSSVARMRVAVVVLISRKASCAPAPEPGSRTVHNPVTPAVHGKDEP